MHVDTLKVKSASIVFIFLLILPLIQANGVGILVRKEMNNGYIEFGHDPTAPVAQERAIMSFSLHKKDGTPVPVDNFFVRISKGSSILFASDDFKLGTTGPAYIVYEFPEKGSYEIDIAFAADNQKMAATFPVQVSGKEYAALYILLAVLALLLLIFWWCRKQKNKKKLFK